MFSIVILTEDEKNVSGAIKEIISTFNLSSGEIIKKYCNLTVDSSENKSSDSWISKLVSNEIKQFVGEKKLDLVLLVKQDKPHIENKDLRLFFPMNGNDLYDCATNQPELFFAKLKKISYVETYSLYGHVCLKEVLHKSINIANLIENMKVSVNKFSSYSLVGLLIADLSADFPSKARADRLLKDTSTPNTNQELSKIFGLVNEVKLRSLLNELELEKEQACLVAKKAVFETIGFHADIRIGCYARWEFDYLCVSANIIYEDCQTKVRAELRVKGVDPKRVGTILAGRLLDQSSVALI